MRTNVKNILLYIISCCIVAMIVMFIVSETNQPQSNIERTSGSYLEQVQDGIVIIDDAQKETTEEALSEFFSLEETQDATAAREGIEELITSYFKAIENCDVETLNNIVDTNECISEEVLQEKSHAIEMYTNFVYYLKTGLVDNTYIVYVVYNVKLKEIDAVVPTIERFYIKANSDGVMYISRIPLDGTALEYLQRIEEQESVIDLVHQVDKKFEKTCSLDERIVELSDIIKKSIWNNP